MRSFEVPAQLLKSPKMQVFQCLPVITPLSELHCRLRSIAAIFYMHGTDLVGLWPWRPNSNTSSQAGQVCRFLNRIKSRFTEVHILVAEKKHLLFFSLSQDIFFFRCKNFLELWGCTAVTSAFVTTVKIRIYFFFLPFGLLNSTVCNIGEYTL